MKYSSVGVHIVSQTGLETCGRVMRRKYVQRSQTALGAKLATSCGTLNKSPILSEPPSSFLVKSELLCLLCLCSEDYIGKAHFMSGIVYVLNKCQSIYKVSIHSFDGISSELFFACHTVVDIGIKEV